MLLKQASLSLYGSRESSLFAVLRKTVIDKTMGGEVFKSNRPRLELFSSLQRGCKLLSPVGSVGKPLSFVHNEIVDSHIMQQVCLAEIHFCHLFHTMLSAFRVACRVCAALSSQMSSVFLFC